MRLLIIDDELAVLRTIQLGWPDEKDELITAQSLEEAQKYIYSGQLLEFDCIILDLHLPDASGVAILAEIKGSTATPVIMLSAWGDSQFRADTLNSGADDYLMKPINIVELHARVCRLVNLYGRRNTTPERCIMFGPVKLDTLSRVLSGCSCEVDLTTSESKLLHALITAGGGIVSRQDLYVRAFGREGRYGEKALETYIGRVRKKLDAVGDDGVKRIQSVRGMGYRFVPP